MTRFENWFSQLSDTMKAVFEKEAVELNVSRLELFKQRCDSILTESDLKNAAAYGGARPASDASRYDHDFNDVPTEDRD